ncbi:MAG: hypothetical protein M1368_05255 [Thaumarchaeota archaeon]|nr:hypothetical protein [Nitrososphaerota archaeon]
MNFRYLIRSYGDKLSLVAIAIGGFTSTISILSSRFIIGNNLGIFTGLSWTFYLAVFFFLGALALIVNSDIGSGTRHLIIILLIQFLLSSVGYLVGGGGASTPAYLNYVYFLGGVNFVASSASISAIVPFSAALGAWPASTVFYGQLLSVLHLSNANFGIILFSTQVLQSLFDTVLVFLIAETIFGRHNTLRYLATMVFVFGAWNIQSALQDTGYAYTIFLVMVLMLIRTRSRLAVNLTIGLFFIALILSNLYASLVGMGFVVAYSYIERNPSPLIAYFTLFGAWTAFGPALGYTALATYFVHNIFNIKILFSSLFSASSAGSSSHHFIASSQLSLSVALVILGFAGILSATRINRTRARRMATELLVYLVAMSLITLITGPAFSGNPLETAERLYIFSLPILAVAMGLSIAPKFVPVLLICLSILTPIVVVASYGGVVPTYVSQADEKGGMFLQTFQTANVFVSFKPAFYDQDILLIYYIVNGSLWYHSTMITVSASQLVNFSQPGIMSLGSQEQIVYRTLSPDNYATVADSLYSRMNVVYANPDVSYLAYPIR